MVPLTELFSVGPWAKLHAIKTSHPELTGLVDALPSLVTKSKESSTVQQYSRAYGKYKDWCSNVDLEYFPATEPIIALYLTSLLQKGSKSASINQAYYSIRWAHNLAGVPWLCDSLFIQNVLEACRRAAAQPRTRKEPLSKDILLKLVARYGGADASVKDLRLLTLVLLGFAGFFRVSSELLCLRRCHVAVHNHYLEIHLDKTKTDVYRDGSSVIIAKTGKPTCPYTCFIRYSALADLKNDHYVFGRVSYLKRQKVFQYRSDAPISTTTARELLKSALQEIGENDSLYSLHSLRSGGASAAANNHVLDRLFKIHGRWKSETAKDGYVKDNIKSRLSVSQNLGI